MTSQFIPTDTGGGTVVGNSYLSLYDNCPRRWFDSYYLPFQDPAGEVVARGLTPKTTALPFLTGRILHEALATLYLSGCRDGADTGEWNLDRALDVMLVHWNQAVARREYESREIAETDRAQVEMMLRSYYEYFGPGGDARDWPQIQVAFDKAGQPLVEREFRIRLSSDFVFTCRSDLWVFHNNYLKTMEHKTSAKGWAKRRVESTHYDAQFTGEVAVMRAHLPLVMPEPAPPHHGVLVNVIKKARGVKDEEVALRGTTTRTDAQLERWRLQTLNTLQRIQDSIGTFEKARGEGVELHRAADLSFPTLGTRTGCCHSYNKQCDFYQLCQLPGLEPSLMRGFRTRTEEENTNSKEWAS